MFCLTFTAKYGLVGMSSTPQQLLIKDIFKFKLANWCVWFNSFKGCHTVKPGHWSERVVLIIISNKKAESHNFVITGKLTLFTWLSAFKDCLLIEIYLLKKKIKKIKKITNSSM